ncbi:MAG: rod-binding protein [Candidatus Brocadia sp.]|nr:rod-binding protein [Candidatus Brocadia sp.]
MEHNSSVNSLLLSQPSCVEAIKALNQQNNIKKDDLALKKVSQDFESILVNFVISTMWKTIQKSDLNGENDGGMEAYTEMMHACLSQDIAAKGGFGVAPIIYEQLIRNRKIAEQTPVPAISSDDDCPVVKSSEEGADKSLNSMHENGTKGVVQP